MNRSVGPSGVRSLQRNNMREEELLGVLPLSEILEDLIEPLRPKQPFECRPNHDDRRAALDEPIENLSG